jgi:hypothetical protein
LVATQCEDEPVTATDLSTLALSDTARRWVSAADPTIEITNHAVRVDLDWWNTSLSERGLPGGPVTGLDGTGDVVAAGRCVITRGHVFGQAADAAADPDAALRLLWHALAWGSGVRPQDKYGNNLRRMDSVAADLTGSGEALVAAARLSGVLPIEAYRRLYPGDKTLIGYFGPSFLTKYLCFAGQGTPTHPCVILDRNVAASLIELGWTSLSPDGHWPATTYERYIGLLSRWRDDLAIDRTDDGPRLDLVERWLFDNSAADTTADD